MKTVEIYTDGACRGNPGPGGWAAILVWGQREKELSDGEALTTNNRMELLAAIRGLEALKERCHVVLYSDSKYLVDAVTLGWAVAWKKKDWKKADGSRAKNDDLWEVLLTLLDAHEVEMRWVKGHNGHGYNERCDALATARADAFRS